MKRVILSSHRLTAGILGSVMLLASACSSDRNDNATPTPSNATGGGAALATGGAAGETGGAPMIDATGGAMSTGGEASTGGAANPGTGGAAAGAAATGGAATAGSSSAGPCVHDATKTCYECPPTTNDQILTACSNASCQPFDNAARGVSATLPAIP